MINATSIQFSFCDLFDEGSCSGKKDRGKKTHQVGDSPICSEPKNELNSEFVNADLTSFLRNVTSFLLKSELRLLLAFCAVKRLLIFKTYDFPYDSR